MQSSAWCDLLIRFWDFNGRLERLVAFVFEVFEDREGTIRLDVVAESVSRLNFECEGLSSLPNGLVNDQYAFSCGDTFRMNLQGER